MVNTAGFIVEASRTNVPAIIMLYFYPNSSMSLNTRASDNQCGYLLRLTHVVRMTLVLLTAADALFCSAGTWTAYSIFYLSYSPRTVMSLPGI